MKCSLIVMVYNDIKTLTLTFEALKIQTEKEFEVIIADDGSNSDFVSRLQKLISEANFKVKHIWHEDNGWQKEIVMNKAIVASESDYIIFIDGDCIPHKRFIEEHLKLARQGQIVAGRRVMLTQKVTESLTPELIASRKMHSYVWPRILWASLTGKINQAESVIRLPLFLRKILVPQKRKGLLGCNFSLYKKDILAVNGFDERYIYPAVGEDTDFEYRLNRIGIYCTIERHLATVYHIWHKFNHAGEEKNLPLFEENNSKNVSWTPYGIIKGDSK